LRSAGTLAIAVLAVVLVSCGPRVRSFQVIPETPEYLLRTPDAQQVAFPDIPRAYNGFVRGGESVDLQPLMELRIENAYYKPGASRRGLDGFLGTETARYEVCSGGLKLLAVEPMKNRPEADPAVQDLIRPSQMHFRAYRFYFEIVFARSRNARGSVLLGANSEEELKGLAAQLRDPELVCGNGAAHCTVFPEACSVAVYMKIVVNQKPQDVVWGSKLSSVIESPRPFTMKRLYNGRLLPVRVKGDPEAVLAMPLLPGDQITLR
jgi:hypothetical protein